MNEFVKGIILRQMDYKESDTLLAVYTKEFGRLSFIAKGSKKPTSKNAAALLPCTIAEISFDYKENKTLFPLKTARTIHLYRKMHENLSSYTIAEMMAEVVDILSGQLEEEHAYYDWLEKAFGYLEEGRDPYLVLSTFMANILLEVGVIPEVDACVNCGNVKVRAFGIHSGGFLCGSCAELEHIEPWDKAELAQMRLVIKGGLEEFDTIEKTGPISEKVALTLVSFFESAFGVQIHAFLLYKRLFSVE